MALAPEVVLVRAGALGDLLLLRPTVYACRRRGLRVALVAPALPAQAVLGDGPADIQSVIDWESLAVTQIFGAPGRAGRALMERLRRSAGILVFSRQKELIVRLAGLAASCTAWDPTPPPGIHASAWYLKAIETASLPAQGDAAGAPHGPAECPLLEPSLAEHEEAASVVRRLPDGFLAIHPGSGSTRKNWPAESFAQVVFARSGGQPWLLVEGPADGEAAARLVGLPHCVRARGLRLRVLAAVLSRSGCFVGNDSGVTHLAAASGAPTLALFGPSDPVAWHPAGRIVRVLQSPTGHMEGLDPSVVIAAVEPLG
jgi:heptosyltransferase III